MLETKTVSSAVTLKFKPTPLFLTVGGWEYKTNKKMDWKVVCEVGFKVLTAAVAGAAVFVGISKAMTESGNRKKEGANPGGEHINPGGCVFDPTAKPPMQCETQQNEPVILASMRATQDSCSKLLAFVQSLTLVTENLTRIFGGHTAQPGIPMYGQNPWSYRQPVTGCNGQTVFTRVSPFIIEAGPVLNNCRGFYPY